MQVRAVAKRVRISAQKARLVADQVRGKPVAEALNILSFSNKKGAALERLGRRSQALIEYRAVANRYPNSEAGKKAREKITPQQ